MCLPVLTATPIKKSASISGQSNCDSDANDEAHRQLASRRRNAYTYDDGSLFTLTLETPLQHPFASFLLPLLIEECPFLPHPYSCGLLNSRASNSNLKTISKPCCLWHGGCQLRCGVM